MILFCWLVLCAVLVFGAFQLARPTYEASATLEVTPSERISFPSLNPITGDDAVQAFMKAEQDAILSDRVLDLALAAPASGTSRLVKRSTDPKSAVRQALTIRILPGTPRIQIALASGDRDEPAAIVNAVAGAYLGQRSQIIAGQRASYRRNLTTRIENLQGQIEERQHQRMRLLDQDSPVLGRSAPAEESLVELGHDSGVQISFKSLSVEQYRKMSDKLLQTELDLIEATGALEARTTELRDLNLKDGKQAQDLDDRIEFEFRRDPLVIDLIVRLRAASHELEDLKKNTPKDLDALRRMEKRLKDLTESYTDCWNRESRGIRLRLQAETANIANQSLSSIKARIGGLNATRNALVPILAQWDERREEQNRRAARAAFLAQEIDMLGRIHGQNLGKLEEFELASRLGPSEGVSVVDLAVDPMYPTRNPGPILMALAPAVALLLVLTVFVAMDFVASPRRMEEASRGSQSAT